MNRRYEIEKVCDRHDVSYHPSTGVGRKGQAFLEDLLETVLVTDLARIRGNVDEALRKDLAVPDKKCLTDAIKAGLQADTGVRVVDKPTDAGTLRDAITAGGAPEPQHCPLCGAPALIKATGKLGTPLTTDPGVTVWCSDAGPEHGGCTMPPVDRLTWERFPRTDTVTEAAVMAVAKYIEDGWSGDMYEVDPVDDTIDVVMAAVEAALNGNEV